MPMEVFTISGAPLGATSAPPPVLLQNALAALGTARGDGNLAVTVDGAIGPKTVAAVNYALKNIIGAGPVRSYGLASQAGGRFLNATATKADVQNFAGALATIVIAAVRRAGGTVPEPAAVTARARGGGGGGRLSPEAMQALQQSDTSSGHPMLPWILGGAALVVAALGFMAARRQAAT